MVGLKILLAIITLGYKYFHLHALELWPNATIPYKITSDVFTKNQEAVLLNIFRFFEDMTCIRYRFVKRSREKHYMLVVKKNQGCSATVGLQPKRNRMRLSDLCFIEYGRILHELIHMMGFPHTHTRSDRDKFIKVKVENIIGGICGRYSQNFAIDKNKYHEQVPYDYKSIMHYGTTAFSENGEDTLVPKYEENAKDMGQRQGPTNYDLSMIVNTYCSEEYQKGPHLFDYHSKE